MRGEAELGGGAGAPRLVGEDLLHPQRPRWVHFQPIITLCTPGKFTLYFPYILLIAALVLTGIERFFNKIFKSNIQVKLSVN